MTEKTEAEAVADIAEAKAAAEQTGQPLDGVRTLVVQADQRVVLVDDEYHLDGPRRSRGVVETHDANSFVAAVNQRRLEPVSLYADLTGEVPVLTAVLNDDQTGAPGWRDNNVVLVLVPSPEWTRWTANEGLFTQERFAEHVEDSTGDFVEPDAATMLSLAQTFQATMNSRFRAGANLGNGARQIVVEDDIDAVGGSDGSLTIPKSMKVALRPFLGSVTKSDDGTYKAARYTIEALFRYRIDRNSGSLAIGYKLVDPNETVRTAFEATLASIEADLPDVTVIHGKAPSWASHAPAVSPGR